MSGPSFHGTPVGAGRGEQRVAIIVVVLLVGFVGLALAKPWGSPSPTPAPPAPAALVSPAASSSRTPAGQGPSVSAVPEPLEGFTTPIPPLATAAWIGLRWRRLAPDDPFGRVIFTLRLEHGFIAVGWDRQPGSPQLLWTSESGSDWLPLPLHGPTTLPQGAELRALVERPGGGVAALTQGSAAVRNGSIAVWVSDHARRWISIALPDDVQVPDGFRAPLLASGPAGLLLATVDPPREGSGQGTPPPTPQARVLRATEASGWQFTERALLPERFELTSLTGTATGYLAVGLVSDPGAVNCAATGSTCVTATVWSPDGLRWPTIPTVLPTLGGRHPGVGGAFAFVQAGRDGLIVREVGETRSERWWQSSDARHWRPLPTYPPLGATRGACDSIGCYTESDGYLLHDGRRLVAVRFSHGEGAWASTDGRTWQRLALTGDIPGPTSARQTFATLLPGGLLFFDGTSTWFGEAVVR